MNLSVKQISDEVRLREWMLRIKTCRESGLPVAQWCRENNVVAPTYYYWLKKIRELAVESVNDNSNIVDITPIIEQTEKKDTYSSNNQFLKIHKGDSLIEIPVDCPEWILEKVLDKLC